MNNNPVAWKVQHEDYVELWTDRRKQNAFEQAKSLRETYPDDEVTLTPLYEHNKKTDFPWHHAEEFEEDFPTVVERMNRLGGVVVMAREGRWDDVRASLPIRIYEIGKSVYGLMMMVRDLRRKS